MNNPSAFPFKSQYVTVKGHKIHYVEEGSGPPILLIHGNPTWSYQWRNIMTVLSKHRRCVAFDLLGFGRSDKPNIEYTFKQHAEIVSGFIEQMNLQEMIMIVHDWGASFGLWHMLEHQQSVNGIVMFEPLVSTSTWDDYQGERRTRFEKLRDPKINYDLVQIKNLFVEQLPNGVWNKERMTEEIMDMYRSPFPTPESRKAVRRFPEILPIGEDSEAFAEFKRIEDGLDSLNVPVLLLTVTPGAILNEKKLSILKEKIVNLEIKNLGPGLHHFQEDYPEEIANSVIDWMKIKSL